MLLERHTLNIDDINELIVPFFELYEHVLFLPFLFFDKQIRGAWDISLFSFYYLFFIFNFYYLFLLFSFYYLILIYSLIFEWIFLYLKTIQRKKNFYQHDSFFFFFLRLATENLILANAKKKTKMIGGSRRENEGEKTNGKGLGRTHIKRKSSLIKKKKKLWWKKGKGLL